MTNSSVGSFQGFTRVKVRGCRLACAIAGQLLLAGILDSPPAADDLSDFQKAQAKALKEYQQQQKSGIAEQSRGFGEYRTLSRQQFLQWQKEQQEEYDSYRKSIKKQWGEFIEPSNKKWVEYGKDAKSVASVDFEKGAVTVEALRLPGESSSETQHRLDSAIVRIVKSRGSMEAVPAEAGSPSRSILAGPLLQNQVALADGQAVTAENVERFVAESAGKPEVVAAGKGEKVVLTFPLVPDHLKKRMMPYLPYVRKYCDIYKLDPAHVLATIHTESYFNAAARSPCGALGLMQLVPDKGGAEAYAQLKGNGLIPGESYLYDPEKNIELGCVYINLLKTKYFGDVTNAASNTYCSIAGYNTGPANVAHAFTGVRETADAVASINAMDSSEVYSCLIRNLPYGETRDYLQKVVERMALYR